MSLNLKQIRQSRGLSVAKLSEITGLHRRTIQDIEVRGDCMVSTAIKLATALDVGLDELCLGGSGDEGVEPLRT